MGKAVHACGGRIRMEISRTFVYALLWAWSLSLTGAPANARAEIDVWQSGYSLDDWGTVSALQRFPLRAGADQFEWERLCQDRSPFVRAAALLAISRATDVSRLPLLHAAIDDESELVRYCAVRGLAAIGGSHVQRPLLDVIRSRADLLPYVPPFVFDQFGVPGSVAIMSREQRQLWFEHLDEGAIKPGFGGLWRSWTDEEFRRVLVCPETSEWDAGAEIAVTVALQVRPSPQESRVNQVNLTYGTGFVRTVAPDGSGFADDQMSAQKLQSRNWAGVDEDMVLHRGSPEADGTELTLASTRKPLEPGIYVAEIFKSSYPLLIRVRRNLEMERRIPELLQRVADRQSMKELGALRVRSAVPALTNVYQNAGARDEATRYAAARALAQIGDPSAIPALLEGAPLGTLCHGRPVGDLRAFGRAADAFLRGKILNWKAELAEGRGCSLALALLAVDASSDGPISGARVALIEELSRRELPQDGPFSSLLAGVHHLAGWGRTPRASASQPVLRVILRFLHELMSPVARLEQHYLKLTQYVEWSVLRAALASASSTHPREVVGALWRARHGPEMRSSLVELLGDVDWTMAGPIATELWQRIQENQGVHPAFRAELLRVFRKMESPLPIEHLEAISSRDEALALLRARYSTTDENALGNLARLVEAFRTEAVDGELALEQGTLMYELGWFGRAEELLGNAVTVLDKPWQQRQAYYFRGEARVRLGRVSEGKVDLEQAYGLMGDEDHLNRARINKSLLRRRIDTVWPMPKVAGLHVSQHDVDMPYRRGKKSLLGFGREFALDDENRLFMWNPRERSGRLLVTLPHTVIAFLPVDKRRVLVALSTGSVALYEEGSSLPVWRRDLSASSDPKQSGYFAALEQLITIPDDEERLHVIDTETGVTRWTLDEGAPSRWAVGLPKVNIRVQSRGGRLVLPDRLAQPPKRIDAYDVATGRRVWSYDAEETVLQLEVTARGVYLLGRGGSVTALSLDDGSLLWTHEVESDSPGKLEFLSVTPDGSGERIFVGVFGRLRCHDALTGAIRWSWLRDPNRAVVGCCDELLEFPEIHPIDGGVCFLVRVKGAAPAPSPHIEVAVLSNDGQTVLHEISPVTCGLQHSVSFAEGSELFIRSCATWERWNLTGVMGSDGRE